MPKPSQFNDGLLQDMVAQDPSSNAMTEVALGLCMAFFALLVLALISISLPSASNNPNLEQSAAEKLIETAKISLSSNPSNDQAKSASESNATVIIYWAGTYMDVHKNELSAKEVANHDNLILAVDPQISFNQLLEVQNTFKDKEMKLTSLSQEWLSTLQ